MASIYGGKGGGRRGSIYKNAAAKPSGGKSAGGFVGNLAADASDAVLGFIPGVVETVRNPVKTAKAVGASYQHTYGPAWDVSLVDLITGKDGARKKTRTTLDRIYEHPLGPILDVAAPFSFAGRSAATVSLRSPGALAGDAAAKTLTKPVSRKGAAVDRLLKKLPAETPKLGEHARYARELERLPHREAMALRLKARPYQAAYKKLKQHEQIALGLIGRAVSPDEYKALLLRERAAGGRVEPKMLKLLDRPDVKDAFANPSARLLDAAEKARVLSEEAASILKDKGRLSAEVAEARPYLAAQLASSPITRGSLDDALAAAKSVPELRQLFDETGRPQPFYLPDKAVPERSFFGRAGGGVGVPTSPVRKTEGINFRTGMIALQPDLLTASYLKTVKFALSDDLHKALMESAVKVPKGGSLPENHIYIRRPVGKAKRPEKIGYQQKVGGDFRRQLDELLPDDDSQLPALTTRDTAEAVSVDGHYLAVPASFAKEAAGEFLRSSQAIRWFLSKPTAVWRALVLNLRPAWLVNNMVGNHLMYAVRYAGPAGLRAYANMVRGKGIPKEFMNELFPEQVEGTFINTQRPAARQKTQDRISLGLAPLDKKVEGGLRRSATEAELRKSPLVKAKLKEMPKQTRSFERAARQALDEDPLLARRVSDRVNDALGNFLDLSPTERGVLRSAFPFYAWYKAIAKVTFKLPLDAPLRADILAKIGLIGAEETRATVGEVPDFLLGLIGMGEVEGGRERVFNTTPSNPWATIPQLGRDLSGTVNPFAAGPARALLGDSEYANVSVPEFVGGSVRAGSKVAAGLPQVRLGQALTGSLYQGTAKQPTLYRRDPLSELLAYLGVPVRELDKNRAKELKERG